MQQSLPALTLKNIPSLYHKYVAQIKQGQNVMLDLSEITEIDSSGIALILELKELATKKNCAFSLNKPSLAVLRLCTLYKINF
jgi:ABC-type transporter Mla MlaB component